MLDFDIYYQLVNDAKKGINPYTVSYMQTMGPPLVLVYFFPFSFFSLFNARALFTIANLFLLIASIFLISKKYYKKYYLTAILLQFIIFASAFPVRFSIEQGQPIMMIAFLITLILINTSSLKRSFYLSAIIALKTNFLLTTLVFLRKKRKILLTTGIFILCLVIFSFIFIKPQWYIYFIENKLNIFHLSEVRKLNYYDQSLGVTLASLGLLKSYFYLVSIIVFVILLIFRGNIIQGLILSIILSGLPSSLAWLR